MTHFRWSEPDCSSPAYQKIGSQLRLRQPPRSRIESSDCGEYNRHHQNTSQQTEHAAQRPVKCPQPGLLHCQTGQPSRQAGYDDDRVKNNQKPDHLAEPCLFKRWCNPARQPLILPRRQQIANYHSSHFEGFVKEASNGCASDGKREKAENDPIRRAHHWKSRTTWKSKYRSRL